MQDAYILQIRIPSGQEAPSMHHWPNTTHLLKGNSKNKAHRNFIGPQNPKQANPHPSPIKPKHMQKHTDPTSKVQHW